MSNIKIELIDDNPYRHKDLNPIEQEQVDKLKDSIGHDGFWSSVVARQVGDRYQLAFGHTRLEAAKQLGLKTVPIEVRKLTDLQMVRMLANENGIQRGIGIAPCLDAVAGVAEYLSYVILVSEDQATFTQNCGQVDLSYEYVKARLTFGDGIGWNAIKAVTTSYKEHDVNESLAIMKASGRMANIIAEAEFKARVVRQAKAEAARLASEQAEAKRNEAKNVAEKKATQQVAKDAAKEVAKQDKVADDNTKAVAAIVAKPVIFDDRCVHLFRLKAHSEVYRKFVTDEIVRQHLPVANQYELANSVLEELGRIKKDKEITSLDIRETCWAKFEDAFGISRVEIHAKSKQPFSDSIKEGLNLLRRSEGDFKRGINLILKGIENGETLDSHNFSKIDAIETAFNSNLNLLKQYRRKGNHLKVV